VDRREPAVFLAVVFPTYWAFNIQWHERPQRTIDSSAAPKGRWMQGMIVST
jgi:hypothetical protein